MVLLLSNILACYFNIIQQSTKNSCWYVVARFWWCTFVGSPINILLHKSEEQEECSARPMLLLSEKKTWWQWMVQKLYQKMGYYYFMHAYQMQYTSFWHLLHQVKSVFLSINEIQAKVNSYITNSVWLAADLQYFLTLSTRYVPT